MKEDKDINEMTDTERVSKLVDELGKYLAVKAPARSIFPHFLENPKWYNLKNLIYLDER